MKRSVKLCLFGLAGILPLLFACGGGGGDGEPAQDGAPPIVSAVSPANGAANVPTTATVSVTFNETMNPATINAATFMVTAGVTQVVGTISSTGTTYTLTPSAGLATDTVYTVTVTAGVMDVAGNAMAANFTSSFTTSPAPDRTPPTVSAVSPANGAANVPATATVSITFNEAMNPATINAATFMVTAGGTQVAGTISSTGTTYTFTPSASLATGTVYAVTVTAGVMDVAGNAMAANFTSSFTTSSAPDTTPPTVSAVSPANGAANVPTTATVAITFNEAMNSSTISAATFMVTAGGTQVAGTISSTGTTYTFTPSASLAGGTLHTVTVTTGARDVAGNAIAANVMSTFTTAIVPANCITAGNRTPDAISCCPGLTRIFVAYYDPVKSCEELSQDSIRDGTLYYICSAVGNGICEPWENRCNAPQDCKFP